MKDFEFTSHSGKLVKYSDVVSGKFKVNCREDEVIIAKHGGIGWEFGGFTEAHCGQSGRTHETEYLTDPKKVNGSESAFDVYEEHCGKLNKKSKVIEFGCNLARNVRIANRRYGSKSYGVDICKEVIDKNNKWVKKNGKFWVKNLRDGGKSLKNFKDNEFDLGITCGFLMHVADDNGNKKSLIKEMIRICKTMWFSEWYRHGYIETSYHEGGGCTTGERLTIYDDKIKQIGNGAHPSQPNEQALYIYK